jgi:hypothetical protein
VATKLREKSRNFTDRRIAAFFRPPKTLACSGALLLCLAHPLAAQLPFYTDDPAVTAPGKWHFEFFDEYDVLQLQFPNVRQNTANGKLNYGLPHNLEVDLDYPYLAIFRTVGSPNSVGLGDLDFGIKWEFHKESSNRGLPALSASLYVEYPTGDKNQQLGSGRHDYWLNGIAQKSLSDKTRINLNVGYLFTGNTSTGVVGILSTRGHVYTGGLSLLYNFTARLTLGAEIYGGYTENGNLGKSQLQVLIGAQYQVREGLSLTFATLGGRYEASPRIGFQGGFAVDFPK